MAAIRQAPIEPGLPSPPIQEPKGPIAPKFLGGNIKCAGLAIAYREVADALGWPFLDASTIISASQVDGVHLDADQHVTLGDALARVVGSLLSSFDPPSG